MSAQQVCMHMCRKGRTGSGRTNPRLRVPLKWRRLDFNPSSASLSLSLYSLPSLLLGYWSSRALWVQRVKAWKAKQPRFQRSHESLKCLLFQPGPGRRVRCASDPRAHLEIQWLNLAHPALNQSIPIISYCLPSATGPDEPERGRENTFGRPRSGERAAPAWVHVGFMVCRWRAKLWECCGHVYF